MTATTMHFGPEWMRTKQGARPAAPSPPLATTPTPPGASTYSALVTPATAPPPERRDDAHPFRYSKEDLLRIYKEGGGKGGFKLGLEVERWDGIVREISDDPVSLKDMSDGEKKLFAGPLNSEIRRRQSTDYLSPLTTPALGDRPKLNHAASGTISPMRERLGGFMGRRRGDSTDQAPLAIPRKLSLSSMQGPLASPREIGLPSPRTRIGQSPGFDGVLSESWSSRRRPTDGIGKSGGTGGRIERETSDGTDPKEIKEEDEELGSVQQEKNVNGVGKSAHPHSESPKGDSALNGSTGVVAAPDGLNDGMASMALDTTVPNGVTQGGTPGGNSAAPGPSPGVTDLASVEWSYLDPQGQIQGPFRADTMQRWHDEGYFSANLLMKRTHLDSEWMSVGEMIRRAGGQPIFLTPRLNQGPPPGLPRRPDPLLEGPLADRERGSPFQPAANRRGTLDNFMHSGPNSASGSPASSFGVAARFANNSPDPNTFDPRVNHAYPESPAGSRLGFGMGPDGQRRTVNNDPFLSGLGGRSPFTVAPGRSDSLGFNGLDSAAPSVDTFGGFGSGFGGAAGEAPVLNGHFVKTPSNGPVINDLHGNEAGAIGGFPHQSRAINRPALDERLDSPGGAGFGSPFQNGVVHSPFHPNGQPFQHNTPLRFQQEMPAPSPFVSVPDRQAQPMPMPIGQQQSPFAETPFAAPVSPWGQAEAPAVRRPGPFDTSHPTAANTIVTGVSTVSRPSFSAAPQQASVASQSPWYTASQNVVSDDWTGTTSSLTTANLGQHDLEHQQKQPSSHTQAPATPAVVQAIPAEALSQPTITEPAPSAPAAVEPVPAAPAEPTRPSQKSRKSSAQVLVPAPAPEPIKPLPSPAVVEVSATTPVTEPAKPAWGKEEVPNGKPSGAAMSLREIQEAEAKKAEARKVAEREREKAARAAATASLPVDDFQPITTSWGLPTSQAGVSRTPSAAKENSTLASSNAVWSNTTKPAAKKTMKEIQEEEEKRKKQAAKEKETVAAAARRAHAETSTTKPVTPSTLVGGAWTTVGSGGKTAAAAAAAAAATVVRPAISTSVSARTVPTAAQVVAPPLTTRISAASVAAAASPRPTQSKAAPAKDETPAPPSSDFMRWMSESLKGLNNSVQYDEIANMLLSFPLDPDSSTMEIISDLIYASSTTLDGRRFASEFVTKRKADVAGRKGAVLAVSGGKTPSIADVVKTQPKPAQGSEWGGFKVVNKKKKGSRA